MQTRWRKDLDKEQRDFADELIQLQSEYDEYVNVVIESKNIECVKESDYKSAKTVRENAERNLERLKQRIITTKQLLTATMR